MSETLQVVDEQPNLGGRPSKYKPEIAKDAYGLCLLGLTDQQLANHFKVHFDTIQEWKRVHDEFSYALKTGREVADSEVTMSLYQRACGIKMRKETPDGQEVIYTVAPDTTACIFWLKNRQKQYWRDVWKIEHSGPDGGPIEVQSNAAQIRRELAAAGAIDEQGRFIGN